MKFKKGDIVETKGNSFYAVIVDSRRYEYFVEFHGKENVWSIWVERRYAETNWSLAARLINGKHKAPLHALQRIS